jgi:hypothetical protein
VRRGAIPPVLRSPLIRSTRRIRLIRTTRSIRLTHRDR